MFYHEHGSSRFRWNVGTHRISAQHIFQSHRRGMLLILLHLKVAISIKAGKRVGLDNRI
jgi:hypothetical protein